MGKTNTKMKLEPILTFFGDLENFKICNFSQLLFHKTLIFSLEPQNCNSFNNILLYNM